ncbi:MAG: universal stress protein [Thiotrichaceae bacterium]
MKYFQNILVALDYQAGEQAEIDHALILAKSHSAKVTFISVIAPLPNDAHLEISAMSPEERLAKQITTRETELESVAECIKSHNIEVEIIVVSGAAPSDEIIKQVLRNGHDLLMISERENPSIKNKLIGGTAKQLLRKCPCPVFAVHPNHSGEYDRIMATIDVSQHNDVNNTQLNEAIVFAAEAITEADHSELSLLNIPPSEEAKPAHLESINKCLRSKEINIDPENILLETGDPISVIVETSKAQNIDLLVMGMLSRTGIQGFFIGNTVEKIMDNVECSILTIKPKEFVSPVTLDS